MTENELVPLDKQIAAVREMVERIRDPNNTGRWPSLAPMLPSILATLKAQLALLAEVEAARTLAERTPRVIAEALREMENGRPMRGLLITANSLNDALPPLNKALAALPPAEEK